MKIDLNEKLQIFLDLHAQSQVIKIYANSFSSLIILIVGGGEEERRMIHPILYHFSRSRPHSYFKDKIETIKISFSNIFL